MIPINRIGANKLLIVQTTMGRSYNDSQFHYSNCAGVSGRKSSSKILLDNALQISKFSKLVLQPKMVKFSNSV